MTVEEAKDLVKAKLRHEIQRKLHRNQHPS
jgi:hypothetical protein